MFAFEEADDRLADPQLRENLCRRLSENDAYLDVGPKVGVDDNHVFHHIFRQCHK